MRFWDILKISLHNIFNNKLRTLLVTIVLFVLSTIIIIVTSAGVNIATVLNEVSDVSTHADVVLEYLPQYDKNDGGFYGCKDFKKDEIESFREKVSKELPFLQNVVLWSRDGLRLQDSNDWVNFKFIDTQQNLLAGRGNYLIGGRLWNKSDSGKAYAWINDYCAKQNGFIVGETLNLSVTIPSSDGNYNNSTLKTKQVVIAGVVDYQEYTFGHSPFILLDYNYALSNEISINGISFEQSRISEPATMAQLNKVKSFQNKNNTYDEKKNPQGIYAYSQILEERKMIMLFNMIIVIIVLVVSVIIILLSIGCVSNSIQITVEQNSKFFGMMKAIGMRNNVVKSIVRVQAIISILLAVIFASCLTIGLFHLFNPLLAKVIAPLGITFTLSMPFYVPIVAFALLSIMVILFTIKSLNRISKMDVVSVISEVN